MTALLRSSVVGFVMTVSLAVAQEAKWTGGLSEEEFQKLHQLKPEDAPAPKGVMVDLADGTKAYLALPKDAKPGLPVVIVLHEWWGLNGHIKNWADRFTTTGRAALAVDLYGGQVAADPATAQKLMKAALADEEKLAAKMVAACDFAKSDARLKTTKLASIGWCFGGRMSLQLAIHEPDLAAAVMYYGFPVDDVATLKKIKAPLLGLFGKNDKSIGPPAVTKFDAELTEAGVTHTIQSYDANHAFANPSGANYDAKSAAAAWEQVQKFLDEKLPVGEKTPAAK